MPRALPLTADARTALERHSDLLEAAEDGLLDIEDGARVTGAIARHVRRVLPVAYELAAHTQVVPSITIDTLFMFGQRVWLSVLDREHALSTTWQETFRRPGLGGTYTLIVVERSLADLHTIRIGSVPYSRPARTAEALLDLHMAAAPRLMAFADRQQHAHATRAQRGLHAAQSPTPPSQPWTLGSLRSAA